MTVQLNQVIKSLKLGYLFRSVGPLLVCTALIQSIHHYYHSHYYFPHIMTLFFSIKEGNGHEQLA